MGLYFGVYCPKNTLMNSRVNNIINKGFDRFMTNRKDTTAQYKNVVISDFQKHHMDLNTDFGQTRDRAFYEKTEYELLRYVSSVNIPCGVHDGEPRQIMYDIVKAAENHCSIGAHIGYPDPSSQGYDIPDMDAETLSAWYLMQIGAFEGLLKANGLTLDFIRPHGALYKAMYTNWDVAKNLADTLRRINPWFYLVGPAGQNLTRIQDEIGLRVVPEVYLGKRYNKQGLLMADRLNEQLPSQGMLEQARQIIQKKSLTTGDGAKADVDCRSIHVSPQLPGVVELCRQICTSVGDPVALNLSEVGEAGWLS